MSKARIDECSFDGVKYGVVVTNVDPLGQGAIGVRIAELMPQTVPNESPIQPSPTSVASDFDISEETFSTEVQEQNFIWVKPLFYQASTQDKGIINPIQPETDRKVITAQPGSQRQYKSFNAGAGPYLIPTIGSVVPVIFVDGDPQQNFWLPFSISMKPRPATPMTNVEEEDNKILMNRKVNINVVWEATNGDIFYFDTNDNTNSIVIKQAKGHKLRMESNEQVSQIVMSTEKGHRIAIVDKASTTGPGGRVSDNINVIEGDGDSHISITTKKGHSIVCDDSSDPSIKVTTSSGIKMHMVESGDTITISNTGGVTVVIEGPKISITSPADCTIVSGSMIKLSAPSISMNPG